MFTPAFPALHAASKNAFANSSAGGAWLFEATGGTKTPFYKFLRELAVGTPITLNSNEENAWYDLVEGVDAKDAAKVKAAAAVLGAVELPRLPSKPQRQTRRARGRGSRPALIAGKSSFNNGTIYRVASGEFEDPELGKTMYGPIPDARKRLDFRAAKSAVKHAKKVANHYSADVMVIQYKLVNGHALHREHFTTISPKGVLNPTPPPIADCKWHLVSEDPPKDGTYLGYIPAGEGDKVWPVLFERDEWFNAEGSWRLDVTHWTMLPGEPSNTNAARVWPHVERLCALGDHRDDEESCPGGCDVCWELHDDAADELRGRGNALSKLTGDQIKEIKGEMVSKGVPVRFMLGGGSLDIVSGEVSAKGTNVIHQIVYWNFTKDTAKKIAKWLGARPSFDKKAGEKTAADELRGRGNALSKRTRRLLAAGYTWDERIGGFIKVRAEVTQHRARKDHKDGRIKAGELYERRRVTVIYPSGKQIQQYRCFPLPERGRAGRTGKPLFKPDRGERLVGFTFKPGLGLDNESDELMAVDARDAVSQLNARYRDHKLRQIRVADVVLSWDGAGEVVYHAATSGGKHEIKVYQTDKRRGGERLYDATEFVSGKSQSHSSNMTRAQMEKWFASRIAGAKKYDGINYIVRDGDNYRRRAGQGGRANTVFETYDEAFVEAAAMADRLGRKVELRRAQAFLPKGATRIPGANWLINLVGPHDAVKGQLVNPGEPLTAKQAAIRDGAGRGNQAALGFYGPGLRYLRPAGGRAARDPDDTAVGMLERYSTAKVARSMAFDHAMDYPRKSAQRLYWLNVVKAIEFRAALGTPLSTGGARRPTGPSLEAMDDVEADEYA
jgi:hypothetical protein